MFTSLANESTHGFTDGQFVGNADEVVGHAAADFIFIIGEQFADILLCIFVQMADKLLFFVLGQVIQNIQCVIGIHVGNHFGSLFNRQFFNIFFGIIQIGKDFSYFLCTENRIELPSFGFAQ